MSIHEKDYVVISKQLSEIAKRDGIERTAVKVVLRDGDSILLLKRAKEGRFPDLYELPGGGIKEDEDVFAGAIREVYEETGLVIKEFISQLEDLDFTPASDKKRCRQYIFIVLVEKGDIILNPEEHYEYIWVSRSDIDVLDILPNTRMILQSLF